MVLNTLTREQHIELSNSVVGDTVFLDNYTFKVIECNRNQDSNFVYDEYVIATYDLQVTRYFTYTTIYTIFGYDDWGYEEDLQNYDIIEVEKQETITYTWVQKL
ncbi:hypothetical protein JZU46_06095 [bacterium]|nr:hypothetical protein [bacterium]